LPGKLDPRNVPLGWVVEEPVLPQWPAVTKPPLTEKPTEQRPPPMKYARPPTTSMSVLGLSAATWIRTAEAVTPLAATKVCAAAVVLATTTSELLAGSTYQPATAASAAVASSLALSASRLRSERLTIRGVAPSWRTTSAAAAVVTATVKVFASPLR
jgi:hypothetical protein